MFDRFTDQAHSAIVRAQAEARALEHDFLGTEHLLLGVLASGAAPLAAPLDLETARAEVVRRVGRGFPDQGLDAEGLAALGIDLERVRERIEASFGPGALSAIPPGSRGCGIRGRIPFTGRAKRALELTLREARALGHDHIGPGHLLLGLPHDKGGVGAEILADHGVTLTRLRAAMREQRRAS